MTVPKRPNQEQGATIEISVRVDRLVELEKASFQRSRPHHRLFRDDIIREAIVEHIERGDHWGDAEPYDESDNR